MSEFYFPTVTQKCVRFILQHHKMFFCMMKQSVALEVRLHSIAQEVRAVASVTHVLRRDTCAVVTHTRQLVSAVSGLTMAINALAKGIEGGVQRVGRSLNTSGVSSEQPGEGGEIAGGDGRALHINGH